jgi:hypothetical protein
MNRIDDPAARHVRRRAVRNDLSDPWAYQQAKSWLEDCLNTHTNCFHRDQPLLPSRVLDVGPPGTCHTLRVYESQPKERGKYVTLSYCWGALPWKVTTSETIEEYRRGLNYHRLPRTVQDAIRTTRALGVRYLWIDALCILQDDAADKDLEMNRMGTIYKNAIVTIAAARSSCVSGGFLEWQARTSACWLPFSCQNNRSGKVQIRLCDLQDCENEPLSSRAWTFQESVLSPRLLTFGHRGLGWQCQSKTFVFGTTESNCMVRKPWFFNRLPRGVFDLRVKPQTPSSRAQADLWADLVMDYSQRFLTFPEDKLRAIAGVSNELQRVWGDKYLEGIWEQTFASQLAWRERPFKFGSVPPKSNSVMMSNNIPTWSWAASARAVQLQTLTHPVATLIAHRSKAVSLLNDFGRIRKGELILRAPLKRFGKLLQTKLFWEIDTSVPALCRSQVEEGEAQCLYLGSERRLMSEYSGKSDQSRWHEALRRVLGPYTPVPRTLKHYRVMHGLILVRATDKSWRRVGQFEQFLFELPIEEYPRWWEDKTQFFNIPQRPLGARRPGPRPRPACPAFYVKSRSELENVDWVPDDWTQQYISIV